MSDNALVFSRDDLDGKRKIDVVCKTFINHEKLPLVTDCVGCLVFTSLQCEAHATGAATGAAG